eukprot:SM014202S00712  [mRNA]  locus=s14202:56:337:+ [translate_table: standard]
MLRGHQTLQRIVGKRRRLASRASASPVRAPHSPRLPWRRQQSRHLRRALTSHLPLKRECAALSVVALAAEQGSGAAPDDGALHDPASAAGGPPE